MNKNNAIDAALSQLMMCFFILWAGGLSLTEEQISSIMQILLSALTPVGLGNVNHFAVPSSSITPSAGETVRGISELASIIGVSAPTACKLSRSGLFDAARLDFGTKKLVWDKAKLLELARGYQTQKKSK